MSDNNDELPIITFNSLYNILREEEKTPTIIKLPDNFYKAAKLFLEEKKKEQTGNATIQHKNVYANSLKLFEKLQKIRAKKIAILAIDSEHNLQTYKNELTSDEELFFKSVMQQFTQHYIK